MDFDHYDRIRPIRWQGDHLALLDQRKLPFVVEDVACADSDAVAAAIRDLVVRGAPAIGISAAWGAVLAGRGVQAGSGAEALERLAPALDRLVRTLHAQGGTLVLDLIHCSVLSWLYVRRHGLALQSQTARHAAHIPIHKLDHAAFLFLRIGAGRVGGRVDACLIFLDHAAILVIGGQPDLC